MRWNPGVDSRWRSGHQLQLLENGEAYFPRVMQAIDAARGEILLETFIWFPDKVGLALKSHLVAAARRGVRVHVLVDAFGSPELAAEIADELVDAGASVRMFDPRPPLLGLRTNVFRRLHRKLVVIDGEVGFIGGINYSADHLADFGPEAKQDYAVEVRGPVVADMRDFMRHAIATQGSGEHWQPQPQDVAGTPAGTAEACLLPRDNGPRSRAIELAYREAFRQAREEIIIANAYFFPGYGFLRDLCAASRRGVRVCLLFQGQPDTWLALAAARSLYRHLVDEGVELYEYCQRPFHGKVAVIDGQWSTVGSSNLDPLSLALNLEANLLVRDAAFAATLRERLQRLMDAHCRAIEPDSLPRGRLWRRLFRPLLFHVLRNAPAWTSRMSARRPRAPLLSSSRASPPP